MLTAERIIALAEKFPPVSTFVPEGALRSSMKTRMRVFSTAIERINPLKLTLLMSTTAHTAIPIPNKPDRCCRETIQGTVCYRWLHLQQPSRLRTLRRFAAKAASTRPSPRLGDPATKVFDHHICARTHTRDIT